MSRPVRRLLATTTLALTFVAAPACDKKEEEKKDASAKAADKKDGDAKDGDAKGGDAKDAEKTDDAPAAGGGGDLVGMVPEGAKVIATIDLAGLMGSDLYKQQSAMIDQSDIGKNFAAAKACNLGPDTWKQVVIGLDPDASDDAVVVGMSATGIGKKENIECIAAKYKEEDPKADWKIEDKDGRTVVTLDGGDAIGYAASDDTFVVAGKAWDAAVQERIAGKGTAAKDGALKDAMGLATGGHITFAGLATPDMATGPLTGAKHFGGSLDLGAGVAMSATVVFADAGAAKTASDAINGQFQGVKAMGAGMGIPQPVLDSVKIEAKDANLALGFKATSAELEQVGKAAMGMMMGGGPR